MGSIKPLRTTIRHWQSLVQVAKVNSKTTSQITRVSKSRSSSTSLARCSRLSGIDFYRTLRVSASLPLELPLQLSTTVSVIKILFSLTYPLEELTIIMRETLTTSSTPPWDNNCKSKSTHPKSTMQQIRQVWAALRTLATGTVLCQTWSDSRKTYRASSSICDKLKARRRMILVTQSKGSLRCKKYRRTPLISPTLAMSLRIE